MEFKNITELITEIEKLKQAYMLLERVYLAIGPYGGGKLEDKTRDDISNYFGFDDSE